MFVVLCGFGACVVGSLSLMTFLLVWVDVLTSFLVLSSLLTPDSMCYFVLSRKWGCISIPFYLH